MFKDSRKCNWGLHQCAARSIIDCISEGNRDSVTCRSQLIGVVDELVLDQEPPELTSHSVHRHNGRTAPGVSRCQEPIPEPTHSGERPSGEWRGTMRGDSHVERRGWFATAMNGG